MAAVLCVLAGVAAAQTSMHDRIAAMKPGEWLELTSNARGTIPNTKLERVFPPRQGHPAWAVMGPVSVMLAWCGCALDSKRDLFVCIGGGHNDYGGNEVYGFSLKTLEWQRMTEPSHMVSVEPTNMTFRTVDGTPVSRHTYDGVEYSRSIDRILLFGGSLYRSGGAYDHHMWLFDTERSRWEMKAMAPFSGFPASAYDDRNGSFYAHFGTRILHYIVESDTWSVVSSQEADIPDGTADLDPEADRFFLNSAGKLWYYEVSGPPPYRRREARTSGDNEIERTGKHGLSFDSVGRRILAWAGEREVWALDGRQLVWTKLPSSGDASPRGWVLDGAGGRRPKSQGIYGRWRYVPSIDRFIAAHATFDNVWLYRPFRAGP